MLSLYRRVMTPVQVAHMHVTAYPGHNDMLGIAEVVPPPPPLTPSRRTLGCPAHPVSKHTAFHPLPAISSVAAAGTASGDRACNEVPLAYCPSQCCRGGLDLPVPDVCSNICCASCNRGRLALGCWHGLNPPRSA